jgi:hypothetical protein
LVINELVQKGILEPKFVELVINDELNVSINDIIIVSINDVQANVHVKKDENDMHVTITCDVYFLEVYNLKRNIYPQPQNHYLLGYKQGLLCPLFCLFILFYFVVLLDAMSESTLDMLRIEAREFFLREMLRV